jgi:NADH-quinone oxidoreductase subunit J
VIEILAATTTATTKATIPDILTFVVSAAVIVSGAVGVVTSRNPVHAALSLVMTLFGVAVLFIEQDANFIAAVQIIVYAGAIVVLFLFVIMFLGVDRPENVEVEPLRGQRPLAFLLIAIALAGVISLSATAHWVTGAHGVVGSINGGPNNSGEVGQLGRELFTRYLYAFEATAGLLVIAVVGAVFLSRRPPMPAGVDPDEIEPEGDGDDDGYEAAAAEAEAAAEDNESDVGPAVESGVEPEPVAISETEGADA